MQAVLSRGGACAESERSERHAERRSCHTERECTRMERGLVRRATTVGAAAWGVCCICAASCAALLPARSRRPRPSLERACRPRAAPPMRMHAPVGSSSVLRRPWAAPLARLAPAARVWCAAPLGAALVPARACAPPAAAAAALAPPQRRRAARASRASAATVPPPRAALPARRAPVVRASRARERGAPPLGRRCRRVGRRVCRGSRRGRACRAAR